MNIVLGHTIKYT